MQGSIGADRTVLVPPGTIVRDAKTGRTLCEMFAHGHREMVLPGGRGGRGNASFKTAKNKAPQIAENGEEGMEKWVELELKLVADVGIIGVPNAGKSTLLANVSNAKPKIADYPFTTIVPNLGVVERDFERMVFADIPGLLEGASDGVGLGFEFLRHVKRTRVLVHVLDCTSEDVLEEYDAIRNELFLFDEEVGDKPELIALNKVDASDEAAERALELQTVFEERGLNVHVTSALTGAGVGELITAVKDIWASLPAIDYEAEAAERAAKKLARPADGKSLDEFTVTDTPYAFIIEGAAIERFVQMTNWGLLRVVQAVREGVADVWDRKGGERRRRGRGRSRHHRKVRVRVVRGQAREDAVRLVAGEDGREARGDDAARVASLAALIVARRVCVLCNRCCRVIE